MPSKLSKILSRSTKEKEAEAEAQRNDSNGSSPPPGYAEGPPDYDQENVLDPPDVTAGFSNLNLSQDSGKLPQVDQCIAHLKVLECFYRLRQKIGSTDGLFGIDNSIVLDQGVPSSDKTPEALAKLAEKRWAIYASRAAERFETWSASINPAERMIRGADIDTVGKTGKLCDPGRTGPRLEFDKTNMPPVDVLMVWHAYMLNPRAYLEDCLRLGRMQMWHVGMPWQAAVDCISSESFLYEAGEEAAKNFTSLTGLPWDNLDDLRPKQLSCPSCGSKQEVAYTTCPEHASPKMGRFDSLDSLSKAIDDVLSSGEGYCDKDFRTTCQICRSEINHESLKARKFRSDLDALIKGDVPMGGTVLGTDGVPKRFGPVMDHEYDFSCKFPNRFLRSGHGKKILEPGQLGPGWDNQSMTGIRDLIEQGINDKRYLRSISGIGGTRLTRAGKIGIRRMMSRYWENSTPFALDLVGAVIRQGSFIEKMHNIDWLHSPALPSTMKRLLTKYGRFVALMKDRMHMAVPTLDVDLAWHTHQLSPYSYMDYTCHVTKQFIDHDDKVTETKLNDAFAWTSKQYQKLYGEPYSECTCWYCEAVRESHTSPISRAFNTSSQQANEKLHDAEQDPRKSVHISAHNAVRPDDSTYQANATKKAQQLEKEYQKACERARKKGRKEPRRDDYYHSDAWGYPVYIPAYSPYIGFYPMYMPMYYPVSPGCMALGAGTAGNCCQGTCGGGVAAGACGGGAGGACAAGGCAGGAVSNF